MIRFVKQIFIWTMIFFGSLSNINSLECISMKNQGCKVRPKIINISSINSIFYPFNIKTNKCSGNCNNINDRYARICVPDIVKNLNVKVLNLISRTNETRHIKWHKTCNCICTLDPIICNNKQRWNEDKCKYECKKLDDKGVCEKGYFWNPSNCECECDKSCDIGKYLDYSNGKSSKKLFDKLTEECTENINVVKIHNENKNKNENKYSFIKVHIVYIEFVFFIIRCSFYF